jgi:hypothetical protein
LDFVSIHGASGSPFTHFLSRLEIGKTSRFTEIVELLRLLQSNFFAGKNAIRQKGDITFLHETGQSFSERSSAATEAFTEILVVKFLARQDLIAQD